MKITIVFFLIISMVSLFVIASDVDPFYLQALDKGKTLYLGNEFEPALKNLKIAEFGLLNENEYMKEIYVFKALCYFKLNQTDETAEVLARIKSDFAINDLLLLKIPGPIEQDWKQLVSVMDKKVATPPGNQKPAGKAQNMALSGSFEMVFQQVRDLITSGQLKKAESEIKKLKRINKKDIRIDYLMARICFEKKQYPDCVERLRRVYDANIPVLRDEVLYYLVISYYFVRNYGQALAFYQKIENQSDREKLNTIIENIKAERSRMIDQVSRNFTKEAFGKLVDAFTGDAFIADDVLTRALKTQLPATGVITDIIQISSRFPRSCNLDFYLNASDYFKKIGKIKNAIAILKNSRYYNIRQEQNVELFYRIGELYFQMKDWKRAMVEMARVKALKPGYRDSDRYIENIQILIQGG